MSESTPFAGLPVDPDSQPYWEGCRERELRIARCRSCGRWIHYPRAACPSCWSDDVVAEPVDGRGVLYTWAVFREPAGPYVAAVVELPAAGGVRLPTTVVGCPPEDLTIGMELKLTWIDHDGLPVPAFRPTESAGTGAEADAEAETEPAATAGSAGTDRFAGEVLA